MNSFQLLRTNPLLTTNYRVTIDSDLNLYIDAIRSNKDLNSNKYSHFSINKESFLEDRLPDFYDGLPKEQAFNVKNDKDSDVVYNDYKYQFDDIYYAGSDYVSDTWYKEEFEYFAPLHVEKNNLPDGFVILRVDGPSVYMESDNLYEVGKLTKDNFITEIVDKWKCVTYYDMTKKSNIGYWMNRNITENERFPLYSFELNTDRVTFSKWHGMDYKTGVYTEKSMYLDNVLSYEHPHYRLEKIITEGYKKNSIIYPFIFNFNFLFDDTPATPSELLKYSINRYYGFYVDDMEFVTNLTSYVTPELVSGTTLINNIIVSGMTGLTWDICEKEYDPFIPSINPFVGEWNEDNDYYVYVKDDLHKVERFFDYESNKWIYRVISKEILDDYWDVNSVYDKTVDIVYDDNNLYSHIVPHDGYDNFYIDKYTDCDGNDSDMFADLYLLKVNNRYHVIKHGVTGTTDSMFGDINNIGGEYYIQSDYAISSSKDKLEYWIGGSDSEYYESYDITNTNRKPLVYTVYRIKFSDIKDFDFDRVDTRYSDFDYEKTEYYETIEEKLYAKEYKSSTIPTPIKLEPKGTEFQYKPMSISSEYAAGYELFELKDNGDISDIWVKNPSVCKWGFAGSISHNDYRYKLNNNKQIGSVFNRSVDTFLLKPNIQNKNLDYFYRIGDYYSGTTSLFYKKQSINIQSEFIDRIDSDGYHQNGGYGFNLLSYFNDRYIDYFLFFFENKMYTKDNNMLYTNSYRKYSEFYCDDVNEPFTLFKGLKFKIFEVIDIKRDDNGFITKVISENTMKYSGYKFSIILNDVYYNDDGGTPYNVNGVNGYDGIMNISDDGIHVIVNDIHRSILVIINVGIVIPSGNNTFNNVELFGEKYGLYTNTYLTGGTVSTNYDPSLLTASNFINAINDLNNKNGFDNYLTYYRIWDEDNSVVSKKVIVNGDNKGDIPPIILRVEKPGSFKIKRNSFNVDTLYSPDTSILYDRSDTVRRMTKTKEPLSYKITKNYSPDDNRDIYRFSGPYDPIFKDIDIFNKPIFCYVGFYTGMTTVSEDSTLYSSNSYVSSGGDPYSKSSWKVWRTTENICKDQNDNIPYVYISIPATTDPEDTTYYLMVDSFGFSVPSDSTISGIEVSINRRSHIDMSEQYVKDDVISITDSPDTFFLGLPPENKAKTDRWGINFSSVTYGSSGDTWGASWNSTKVNSSDFSVIIRCKVRNSPLVVTNPPEYNILPDIKCVSVSVYYTYDKQTVSYTKEVYFDKNLKFDTTYSSFGVVSELVYSKVNPDNKKIIRFDEAKYPMVDQFGYSYTDRFIFKSDWDNTFYYKTLDYFDDDSSNFIIPENKTISPYDDTNSGGNATN